MFASPGVRSWPDGGSGAGDKSAPMEFCNFVRRGIAGGISLLLPIADRINHFKYEQRPTKPHAGHLHNRQSDDYRKFAKARHYLCPLVTVSRCWTNGRGRLSQTPSTAGSLLCPLAGNGIATGRMQLQFNYAHNYRHPSGNLYGDGECDVRLRDQNHDRAIHCAVVVVFAKFAGRDADWKPTSMFSTLPCCVHRRQ